jgi:catechol 2,3-dioxygenase-like lactoylglutathione lyase family enzyme
MHLAHLALFVRDQARCIQFYSAFFGFDPASAQTYEDSVVIIRNADGFDLALKAERSAPAPGSFFHIGFRQAGPEEVGSLQLRMSGAGVEIVERTDEPADVSFKCLDPDGYVVEAYWEPV